MKKLFATLCFAVMLLYPQTGSTHEMPEDGHARPAPEYMGSVSVFTSHGIYFRDAGVYTGISLELINFNYGIGYASHTKYYFKSKKIARPFIGVEIGGFSEFSALKGHRQDAYAGERKAYFYAVPSVGIANCFKKVTFEISVRTLIIPGITVEKGSWESGIGVVLGLTF